jgi:hypothetical protein
MARIAVRLILQALVVYTLPRAEIVLIQIRFPRRIRRTGTRNATAELNEFADVAEWSYFHEGHAKLPGSARKT